MSDIAGYAKFLQQIKDALFSLKDTISDANQGNIFFDLSSEFISRMPDAERKQLEDDSNKTPILFEALTFYKARQYFENKTDPILSIFDHEIDKFDVIKAGLTYKEPVLNLNFC